MVPFRQLLFVDKAFEEMLCSRACSWASLSHHRGQLRASYMVLSNRSKIVGTIGTGSPAGRQKQ